MPDLFVCKDNPDSTHNSCTVPQELTDEEIDAEIGVIEEIVTEAVSEKVGVGGKKKAALEAHPVSQPLLLPL